MVVVDRMTHCSSGKSDYIPTSHSTFSLPFSAAAAVFTFRQLLPLWSSASSAAAAMADFDTVR